MVPSAFNTMPQPIRPPASSASSSFTTPVDSSPAMSGFDRDRERNSASAVGTPFVPASNNASTPSSIRIRRLPLNTTEESIRLMTVFSKDLTDVQLLPAELSEDAGYRAAVISFDSIEGALEAKTMLDGKKNISNDATLIVEMVHTGGRRFTADVSAAVTPGSSVASSRGSSRFAFQSFELGSAYNPSNTSVTATRPTSDLANSEPVTATQMQNIFSTQSPIGSHRNEIALHTGKDLINHDTTSDDETRELLKDPVAYAESNGAAVTAAAVAAAVTSSAAAAIAAGTVGPMGNPNMYSMPPQLRRSTTSQLSFTQHMAALSLNTNNAGSPGPLPGYSQVTSPFSAHPGNLPPPNLGGPPHQQPGGGYHTPFRGHNLPPANPADQNPPCNTLYVGNIPMETSEEELKALFSKQRGYKRLSVRTKGNGPMCFVEFEDISFATKTLYELYGAMLRGSTRGGIRLSFSKNPLGVRSGQHPAQNAAGAAAASMSPIGGGLAGNGFAAASGPPPGLSAPPGLPVARTQYSTTAALMNGSTVLPSSGSTVFGGASPPPGYGAAVGLTNNTWNAGSALYYGQLGGSGPSPNTSSAMGGPASGYPPFMMGK